MVDRVLIAEVPGRVDPEAAFAALCRDAPHAFWLDDQSPGGVSYLGAARRAHDAAAIRASGSDVLERLRELTEPGGMVTDAVDGGFALGVVGWLGYELYEETMGLAATRPRRHPDAVLLEVDRALAVDADTGRARLLARGEEWSGEVGRWRERTERVLGRIADATPPASDPPRRPPAPVRWTRDESAYLADIAECRRAIVDGDAYVLCLTAEAEVDGRFDPWEVYRRLRRTSPSHHGALLRSGVTALLSASPEQFLRIDRDRRIRTKPIKGTRPRGATPEEDRELAAELAASEKERAENVMIVDLMRNDLARVCEVGSIEVERLLAVERYPHVHQLVSTVAGRLAGDRDAVDAIAACFPGGSMTGAPKRRAVSILDRLEARSRGPYAGAFGWFGFDGAVDLAMTIRSLVIDADGATIGSGGGITAGSDPAEEFAEMRLKAAALLAALGAG